MTDPEPLKRMTVKDWLAVEVSEKHATAAAEMPDDKLMLAYIGNGVLAALSGEGGTFWQVQAAFVQEMKRRGLKAKGMLS